jgi:hypothetical protein
MIKLWLSPKALLLCCSLREAISRSTGWNCPHRSTTGEPPLASLRMTSASLFGTSYSSMPPSYAETVTVDSTDSYCHLRRTDSSQYKGHWPNSTKPKVALSTGTFAQFRRSVTRSSLFVLCSSCTSGGWAACQWEVLILTQCAPCRVRRLKAGTCWCRGALGLWPTKMGCFGAWVGPVFLAGARMTFAMWKGPLVSFSLLTQ